MHFSAIVVALVGAATAVPTLEPSTPRTRIEKKGLVVPICVVACAAPCAAIPLDCLACLALCGATGEDGGVVNPDDIKALVEEVTQGTQ
ncbi:hypothetical protein K4F52_001819 [Lecanicillium sp. MT-2017a]|nr:hypothetical protein K4F52_001819 [Lecanicillium sp. MT-2017a]